jgi:hypothetical protein
MAMLQDHRSPRCLVWLPEEDGPASLSGLVGLGLNVDGLAGDGLLLLGRRRSTARLAT